MSGGLLWLRPRLSRLLLVDDMGSILKDRYEKANNECVKLANQRFGLEYCVKELCKKLNLNEEKILSLAKNRDIEEMIRVIHERN